MNNSRHGLYVSSAILIALASACTSDEEPAPSEDSASQPQTPEPTAPSSDRLDASSRAELIAAGGLRYRGQARITGEADQGSTVRVSFDPDSGPICLRGDEYAAFYTDRGSDKTLILLDGGGACWTGMCQAESKADPSIDPKSPAALLSQQFTDWNVLFAPYCDGSVFWGDNVLTESDGSTRYQHGRQNLAAALDLAEQHFGASKQLLLAGWSAGGYGTLLATLDVRLRFPETELAVINDSGPGLQNNAQVEAIEARLNDWRVSSICPIAAAHAKVGAASGSSSWPGP